jgi:diguanylate cyclase (GGDEF)-like protein/PAS domain S-box-containing protein
VPQAQNVLQPLPLNCTTVTLPAPDRAPDELASKPASWQPTLAFLRYAIITILAGSTVFLVIILFVLPDQRARAIGPGLISSVALLSAYLLRQGRLREAVLVLAGGIWLAVTAISLMFGGIRSTIYYAHPLLIFLLGWMVSSRAAIVAAILTSVLTVVLIVADAVGWLSAEPTAPLALHGVVQIFVYILTAAMVTYLVQAYRRQLEEVEQSDMKFGTAFASSPVAASIATLQEGRLIEVNANFERDFGWSKEDLVNRTALGIGLWPTQHQREDWADTLSRLGRTVNYETVWRHRNGSLRQVSISGEIIELNGVPCILAYTTDITERKAAEQQIQRLAFYDALTNLPNRRLLMDRLGHAMAACARHRHQGALLFIDLDNFKTLNDTHGHDKGDLLLQQVGARLAGCVREGDTVARLGGDEFVVMLEELSGNALEAATQAETVARKIMAALNASYDIQPLRVHSTPSMGITLFGAEHENLEEPIKRADLAMYQSKAAGRNTIRFFDPRMQAVMNERAELEHDMRQALRQGEFILHYQPQVQRSGRVAGVEVLLRWPHARRGLVPPGTFIPLAEETGLIVPLGVEVLEQACRQLALWSQRADMAHLTLSVNVSPRQFQREDFVAEVQSVLQRTGAPAQRLQLELTEGLLVSNVDDVIAKMELLKAQGVGFALDDFGTGYSSLSYLKRLPLDQLKIDQGFVHDILVDPNDAAIARMVIVLGESLGLEVLAEGVETVEQQQALQAEGCHAYQGYLYSRPLPLAQFEQLAQQPDWPVIRPAA